MKKKNSKNMSHVNFQNFFESWQSEKKSLNPENLGQIWSNQGNAPITFYCGDEDEYLRLFDKHFKGFSGTILEIGPGTGYLCKHIINSYNVQYTLLETEKNINVLKQTYLKEEQYNDIAYITSREYEKIFLKEYDLLISTFCLPETPEYYWRDILDKIKVNNCFMIDDGLSPSAPRDYENGRNEWLYNNFDSHDETEWIYTISGYRQKGIQLSIGKNKQKGVA